MEMPAWGPPRGGFRWIPGTSVAVLVLLRADHSRPLAGPLSSRANSFVQPLQKPASLLGQWRLYSRHRRRRHPCPTVCRSLLRRSGRPDPGRSTNQALRVASLPEPWLPAPTTRTPAPQRAPQARTFVAGTRLRAPWEDAGVEKPPRTTPGRCTG